MVRLITNADVGPLEGVAELCVVELADRQVQVSLVLKLNHANQAPTVAVDIGVGWLDDFAEVILYRDTRYQVRKQTLLLSEKVKRTN